MREARRVVSELDRVNFINHNRDEMDDEQIRENFSKPSVSKFMSGKGRIFSVEMDAD